MAAVPAHQIELPTGTVTMLFSDLEGSTALLTRLGPQYKHVLTAQREVLRAAWKANGGVEMGTEGDSFFVVFRTAPDAAQAAVQAQQELAQRRWPGDVSVRVRMGIHTGSPNIHDGGYVGMDVHRAARIAGAAHGGQIVVSAATGGLVAGALPPAAWLSDLGEHRLKDIPMVERLHQLNQSDRPETFPPLRTASSAAHTIRLGLTETPSPLIGRQDVLTELARRIAEPATRLVTVQGIGGVGKTRLVQQLVTESTSDATFVALLSAERAEDVGATICVSLGIDTGSEPAESSLIAGLRAHGVLLLVLDNFEHVLSAAPLVDRLLREVPALTIVVTSRYPLNLAVEQRFSLPPLTTTAEAATPSVAAELLLDRIRRVDSGFAPSAADLVDAEAIAELCEGLPLAIEIAAARTNVFDLGELRDRLARPLSVLVRPGSQGQHGSSVAASIEWSMNALTADVRRTLAVSTIFRGGCTAAALSAISGNDAATTEEHLHQLLEHNLIRTAPSPGRRRFDSLQVVREVAAAHTSEDELTVAADRHVQYCLALLGAVPDSLPILDTYSHLEQIRIERANLRSAVRHAETSSTQAFVELITAIFPAWTSMGEYQELREWAAAGLLRPDLQPGRRIDLMVALLYAMRETGEPRAALLDQARTLAAELGDNRRLARVLALSSEESWNNRDFVLARQQLAEAFHVVPDVMTTDFRLKYHLLQYRANLEAASSNFDLALADLREMASLADRHGLERAANLNAANFSEALLAKGDFFEARAVTESALNTVSSDDLDTVTILRVNHGISLLETGQFQQALGWLESAMSSLRDAGSLRMGLEAMLSVIAARARLDTNDHQVAIGLGVYMGCLDALELSMLPFEQLTVSRHLARYQDSEPDSARGRAVNAGRERVSRLGAPRAFDATVEELLQLSD